MYYTYVLQSLKNGRNYIGSTEDLKKRVKEHNSGVGSVYTSSNRPFKLIYYEAYLIDENARLREKRLKHYGQALSQLKRRVGL